MNFVRLTDLAVTEYEAGRAATAREWSEKGGSLVAALAASGHFRETFVTSVHRAVVHAKASRANGDVPPWLQALLPSRAEVLSGGGDETIRGMRDVVQHLEARILGMEPATGRTLHPTRPRIQLGEPVALMVDGDERRGGGVTVWTIDRIELSGHRIALADLARWMGELHDLAGAVVDNREDGRAAAGGRDAREAG